MRTATDPQIARQPFQFPMSDANRQSATARGRAAAQSTTVGVTRAARRPGAQLDEMVETARDLTPSARSERRAQLHMELAAIEYVEHEDREEEEDEEDEDEDLYSADG